jgi:outer membrane protein OmpA-like peptidoglycan-associated protein
MNKNFLSLALLLSVLVGLSGCGKKGPKNAVKNGKKVAWNDVSVPVADDGVRSFFDDNMNEFSPEDCSNAVLAQNDAKDFAWAAGQNEDGLNPVYFDFDRFAIRPDQEKVVGSDVKKVKSELKVAQKQGDAPVIVVEGHACHAAGSSVYNMALSEKRAKVLADRLSKEGVPAENMKIVGRGNEVSAVLNGKAVTGSREEQWANRRDEIRVVRS